MIGIIVKDFLANFSLHATRVCTKYSPRTVKWSQHDQGTQREGMSALLCGLLNVKRRAVSGLLTLSSATAQQRVLQSSCALTKNPVANSTTSSPGAGGAVAHQQRYRVATE